MKAEIISVGTEITTGITLNTNSQYIARNLLDLGIETVFHTSVDDNVLRLKEAFEIAISRSDLIITTGGLGPTEDDFTKETCAEFLGRRLIMDEDMKLEIINRFDDVENVPKNNFKQAEKIEASEFLFNEIGTAPGSYIEYGDKIIALLPGPPREMEPMLKNQLLVRLKKEKLEIITESINLTGLGESFIEENIKDLIHLFPEIEIATFGKTKSVEIQIIARGLNELDLKTKIDFIRIEIEKRFKKHIYSYNGISIEEVVLEKLKDENLKIAFSESCTGGLLSGSFVRLPGVSQVFDRAYITYSNQAKMEDLGVKVKTLEEFGAVSRETSREMALGVLRRSQSDIGVSITGIVGPESDQTNKPIGLIYISVGNKEKIESHELRLRGDRKNLQDRIVVNSFFLIREFLEKNY